MKLKQIYWDKGVDNAFTRVMGVSLSVYKNNGKWDACLTTLYERPEVATGFDTADEAMRYAEQVLLQRELRKYFNEVSNAQENQETSL